MAFNQQNQQPVLVSNEVDDFEQGGLYPGGSCRVNSCRYRLWDYDGAMPPDSVVSVALDLQPIDGSNDGKQFVQHYSVGNSSNFTPSEDGKFLFNIAGTGQMKNSTNWAYFSAKLKANCGLEKGRLSQPGIGLAALDGTEFTLVRTDQPTRDGLEPAPAAPGQAGKQERKKTILIPTRATFPWDRGGAGKPIAAAPAPAAGPQAVPPRATPAPQAPPPSPPPTNGQGNGGGDWRSALPAVLESMLSTSGSVSIADPTFMKGIIDSLGVGLTSTIRIAMIKEIKTGAPVAEVAKANGWTFDGATLSV
jgi:hypothetical protein